LQSLVHQKLVERAIQECGGTVELAMLLNVSQTEVAEWLRAARPLPTTIFLKLVDCFIEDHSDRIESDAPVKIVSRPAILLPVVREIADCALDEARLRCTTRGSAMCSS